MSWVYENGDVKAILTYIFEKQLLSNLYRTGFITLHIYVYSAF